MDCWKVVSQESVSNLSASCHSPAFWQALAPANLKDLLMSSESLQGLCDASHSAPQVLDFHYRKFEILTAVKTGLELPPAL